MCKLSALYSQEGIIKEFQKLTLENDSLKKELEHSRLNSTKELQTANDSIARLNTIRKSEVSILNNKIGNLEKDTAQLSKQIKNLDKNNIESLKMQLQQKRDSIYLLVGVIKERDKQIATLKSEGVRKEQEKYNNGQQNVYNQIGQIYQQNTLDSLIAYSTPKSVERDLQLVGNNAEAMRKLQYLQIYFTVQQVLKQRYDEDMVKNAQEKANTIPQSYLVKNLNDKLRTYKLSRDGLIVTIGKIIELDKKFIANDDHTQEAKLQDVLSKLSWYFRNYRFNFIDYPYLSDIVLEIMKQKQKDANSDVSRFLEKL